MSSGPVGLDVREYVYGVFPYTVQAGGFQHIDAFNSWLVTKVQVFAGPTNAVQIALDPHPSVTVQPNACFVFEPNGAFKGPIDVLGEGGLVVVEYWFQAQAGRFQQNISIVVST